MTANAPTPNTVPIKKHITPVESLRKSINKPTYDGENKTLIEATGQPPIIKDEKPTPKKKFVRKPHLTDRPFADNMDLLRLRTTLEQKQRRQQRVNIKNK